jgi:GGDEF domain-containing protein
VRQSAERLPTDVRGPDLVHHLGEGRFAVVLPESSLGDAERLARRLLLALGAGRTPLAHVELRGDDDAVSLLERAEAALDRVELLAGADTFWSKAIEPGA